MSLGLYLHIPYCFSKCRYCDFYSHPGERGVPDAYVDALLRELHRFAPDAPLRPDTLYFGGGTPSLLTPAQAERLIRAADPVPGAEITLEANPETVTEENVGEILSDCSGVIVPGGFGNRGIEGKIITANYCRVNNLPYLGICLGMQTAVIAFARYVAGMSDANSGEFDVDSTHKVIDFLPDQSDEVAKGGTLRLGAYPCKVKPGTQMYRAYGKEEISERHRHRYEFNNDYRKALTDAGLVVSGTSPDDYIVETVEIPENDFYIGVQFHPEFKSRPNKAHPLFLGLVGAALKKAEGK